MSGTRGPRSGSRSSTARGDAGGPSPPDAVRVCIVAPGVYFGRMGWARPAFSPGAYHVRLDGERIELMFYRDREATGNEFEPCK
jgi:hypothetical protein